MYYPFLRARQFELIALRELANENAIQEFVIPILEPVKDSQNGLNLAYKVFEEKGQKAYLIVNSENGDLGGDTDFFLDYLASLNSNIFNVAFHFRDNAKYILNSIEKYSLFDCMLLCSKDLDSNGQGFMDLAKQNSVSVFTVEDPGRNRSLLRFIKTLQKGIVRLDDLFEKQIRNSEYLNIDEHRFSEEHLWFKDENYAGFSDFTTLPSEFIEGGSTPRAVVIHWTFLKDNKEIWIRHFTSETNDTVANVQGKFGEAATKAVEFISRNKISNSASQELSAYYLEGHYPGLGMVKKMSIKNHLLVVSDYLKNS